MCVYDSSMGDRVGSVVDDSVYDLNLCCVRQLTVEKRTENAYGLANNVVPSELGAFIKGGSKVLAAARHALQWVLDDGGNEGPAGEPLFRSLKDVKLRAPILSSTKVCCMGGVFPTHLQIAKVGPHEFPIPFYKMTQLVVGPDEWVIIPKHHPDPVVYGAELTAVIGGRGRSVTEEQAEQLIWGYTVFNDMTIRGEPNPIHKEFETSAPTGPWIIPKDQVADPHNLKLLFRINGEQVQYGSTNEMLASIPAMIAEVSKWVFLSPGDIVATGDLGATVLLKPGDIMEAEVEGIGILRNPVKMEEDEPFEPVR